MGATRRFLGSRCGHRVGRLRARPAGEGGFALLEVTVALVVLLLVLTGLGFEMATQYRSVGSSRNEEAGQALLARALNEIRSLPYTVVAKGLATSTVDATVVTPTYIATTGTLWTFTDPALSGQGTGEAIVHYAPKTSLPPPPFYKHKTVTTVNNAAYTVLTFPTKYGSTVVTTDGVKTVATWVSRVVRTTVIVSWHALGSTGQPTMLVGQTLVFDKTSACATLGSVTASGTAPCQPDFTIGAYAGNGVIALRPAATATTAISGLAITNFDLALPGVSSTETLTQTSSVLGTAEASGVTVVPTSTRDELARAVSKATNDPAAGTSDYTTATLRQTARTVTLGPHTSESDYWLTATPSALDAGTSVSTTSATTPARRCADFMGVPRTSAPPLPCGAGNVTQEGTAATLTTHLGNLGTAQLASVAPTAAHADHVFTSRYKKGTGTGARTCLVTSGCVYATAEGSLGTVTLGGLPSGVSGPPGWTNNKAFVTLSDFELKTTAWAWAKSGCSTTVTTHCFLTGNAAVTTAGTLSYYTPALQSYATTSLGDSAQTLSKSLTVGTPSTSVTITVALTVGGAQCSDQTPGSSSGKPHVATCTAASLTGTIGYDVVKGGSTVADFVMTINLGPVSATASYQRAT